MRPGEGLLELLELEAGEGGAVPALLALGREVVDVGLALGARGRGPGVRALLLGAHLVRRDAHVRALRLLRRRGCRPRELAGELRARPAHARAARAARRASLRNYVATGPGCLIWNTSDTRPLSTRVRTHTYIFQLNLCIF